MLMDRVNKDVRSKIMSAIRSKHTSPEVLFRKALRAKRVKYRLHYGKENIDIAIPGKKLAIFVDGCFWHSCPKHSHYPKSNRAFWLKKLRRNKARDSVQNKRFKKNGWKIMRFWEHDVEKRIGWCISKVLQRTKQR